MTDNLETIHISNLEDLEYLITKFKSRAEFAFSFIFDSDELRVNFFKAINIDLEKFEEKYYYYNVVDNIHISESEDGYIWISTMGLVARASVTKNHFLNSYYAQKEELLSLLNEAISISSNKDVYDIDSYIYSKLEELTPALHHNLLFYFEIMAKVYLNICKEKVPHTHKLKRLLNAVKKTMFANGHNNTWFHAIIITAFEELVLHIDSIPGGFREEYVKYDDNPTDITIVSFNLNTLNEMHKFITESHEIIESLYYEKENSIYFKDGVYEKLLEKCETEDKRKQIEVTYSFLQNVNK